MLKLPVFVLLMFLKVMRQKGSRTVKIPVGASALSRPLRPRPPVADAPKWESGE